jgi:hypothetical protein
MGLSATLGSTLGAFLGCLEPPYAYCRPPVAGRQTLIQMCRVGESDFAPDLQAPLLETCFVARNSIDLRHGLLAKGYLRMVDDKV